MAISKMLSTVNSDAKGQKLPFYLQSWLEKFYNINLDDISIHVGFEADYLGACAFTFGNKIFFSPSSPGIDSKGGLWLLFHELGHVLQQRNYELDNFKNKYLIQDKDLEEEADSFASYTLRAYKNKETLCTGFQSILTLNKSTEVNTPVIQCFVKNCQSIKEIIRQIEIELVRKEKKLAFNIHSVEAQFYLTCILFDKTEYLIDSIIGLSKENLQEFWNKNNKTIQVDKITKSIQSTVDLNQLFEESFTFIRQAQLKILFKEYYLHELYGFRAARNKTPQQGIRVLHDKSTAYLRDSYNAVLNLKTIAESLFKVQNKTQEYNELVNFTKEYEKYSVYYVNSDFVLEKLKFLGPEFKEEKIKKVSEGFYYLVLEKDLLPKSFLEHIGAIPSAYQLFKEGANQKEPDPDINCENKELLNSIIKSDYFQELISIAKNNKLPLSHIISSYVKLIEGLNDLSKIEKFDKSIIIENALQSIYNLIRGLTLHYNHTTNTVRFYELLMDELLMVLATLKPYTDRDFRDVILKLYNNIRTPSLQKIKNLNCTICLESSGMGAFSTAFVSALTQFENDEKVILSFDENESLVNINDVQDLLINKNYFEVPQVVHFKERWKLKSNIIYNDNVIVVATLNNSDSRNVIDFSKSVVAINKIFEKNGNANVCLVLDITLETDTETLNNGIASLADKIESGKLNVIMWKSFQKYSTLGTGKIMSGMVMSLNCGKGFNESSKFIENANSAYNFISYDENQLMTYFRKYVADDEIVFIRNASKNAFCVQKFLNKNIGFKEKLPFIIVEIPSRFLVVENKTEQYVFFRKIYEAAGLEQRMSFSFLNSSFNDMDKPYYWRLTIGQETEEQLYERFFVFTIFSNPDNNKINQTKPLDDPKLYYGPDFKIFKKYFDEQKGEFYAQKKASILNIVFHIFKDDCENDLINIYRDFFIDSDELGLLLDRLSPEMKANLVENWLKILFSYKVLLESSNLVLLKERSHYLPGYRLALVFIDNLQEDYFKKLTLEVKQLLTRYMTAELDYDIKIDVCKKLIENGHFEKLKFLLNQIDNDLSVFLITEDLSTDNTIPIKIEIKDRSKLPLLLNKVFVQEKEFLTLFKEVYLLQVGDEQELLSLIKKQKIKSYFITNEDIKECKPSFKLDDLLYKHYEEFDKLYETIMSRCENKNELSIHKLLAMVKSRANNLVIHHGLLARDIANDVFYQSISSIDDLIKEMKKVDLDNVDPKEKTIIKDKLKKLLKTFQLNKLNAMYCAQNIK